MPDYSTTESQLCHFLLQFRALHSVSREHESKFQRTTALDDWHHSRSKIHSLGECGPITTIRTLLERMAMYVAGSDQRPNRKPKLQERERVVEFGP